MDTPTTHHDAIYGRPEYSPYTAPLVVPPPAPQQQMLPPLPMRPGGPTAMPSPPASGVSPGLAFILGWIPGVGAIYNGQYAKGLVHALVFGMLVTLAAHSHNDFEPLIGIGIMVFFFYMAFEAFHTAKRRLMGMPVDEFSSLIHFDPNSGRLPVAPVLLIVLGAFFLLANFDLIRVDQILRFWPVGLIGFGVYMLMGRVNSQRP